MPNNLTETQQTYGLFWEQLKEYLEAEGSTIVLNTPKPQYNNDISISRGSVYLVLAISKRKQQKSVEIYLGNPEFNKEFFNQLHADKDAIKKELGLDVVFNGGGLPSNQRARIIYEEFSFDPEDEKNWGRHNKWFKETAENFYSVFIPRLNKIVIDLGIQY